MVAQNTLESSTAIPMSPDLVSNNDSQEQQKLDDTAIPVRDACSSPTTEPSTSALLSTDKQSSRFMFFSPPVSTADLLAVPQEMQIYLFGVLSSRYLKEVCIFIHVYRR